MIDPLSRIPYVNLPQLLAMEGQTERTTELLLQAIKLFPDWGTPYTYLSNHMLGLGRLDEAVAWAVRGESFSEDPMAGINVIGAYIEFGYIEKIRFSMIKIDRSLTLVSRAVKVMPGGVNSPVRAFGAVGGTPAFFAPEIGISPWSGAPPMMRILSMRDARSEPAAGDQARKTARRP